MTDLIHKHFAQLERLCQQYGVSKLELFGSAVASESQSPPRDLDFVVEFRPSPDMGPADQYFGLKSALEAMFGLPIDLVCASAMRNPYFIAEVNQSRSTVYAA